MRALVVLALVASCSKTSGDDGSGITLLSSTPLHTLLLDMRISRSSCAVEYSDDHVTPDLHVPTGAPVRLVVQNRDDADLDLSLAGTVLHVPHKAMRSIAFRIDREGSYPWECPLQKPATIVAQSLAAYTAYVAAIPDPEQDPLALGAKLFEKKGCIACHTTDGKPRVGASMANLWGHEVELVSGKRQIVDASFVRGSLVKPTDFSQKGYPVGTMPSYEGQLKEREIEALTQYIASLAAVGSAGRPN